MTWDDRITLIGLFAVIFMIGYHRGLVKGVEETEKRWSDAVAKGEWDRKHRT